MCLNRKNLEIFKNKESRFFYYQQDFNKTAM